jgi:hypothetical protein
MNATYIALFFIGAAGLAAGAYVAIRNRSPKKPAICHFRCPTCDKKLRYTADRAGRPAICPRCRWVGPLPLNPLDERGPRSALVREQGQVARTLRA